MCNNHHGHISKKDDIMSMYYGCGFLHNMNFNDANSIKEGAKELIGKSSKNTLPNNCELCNRMIEIAKKYGIRSYDTLYQRKFNDFPDNQDLQELYEWYHSHV